MGLRPVYWLEGYYNHRQTQVRVCTRRVASPDPSSHLTPHITRCLFGFVSALQASLPNSVVASLLYTDVTFDTNTNDKLT